MSNKRRLLNALTPESESLFKDMRANASRLGSKLKDSGGSLLAKGGKGGMVGGIGGALAFQGGSMLYDALTDSSEGSLEDSEAATAGADSLNISCASVWEWRIEQGDLSTLVRRMRGARLIGRDDSLAQIVTKIQQLNAWNDEQFLTLVELTE